MSANYTSLRAILSSKIHKIHSSKKKLLLYKYTENASNTETISKTITSNMIITITITTIVIITSIEKTIKYITERKETRITTTTTSIASGQGQATSLADKNRCWHCNTHFHTCKTFASYCAPVKL